MIACGDGYATSATSACHATPSQCHTLPTNKRSHAHEIGFRGGGAVAFTCTLIIGGALTPIILTRTTTWVFGGAAGVTEGFIV